HLLQGDGALYLHRPHRAGGTQQHGAAASERNGERRRRSGAAAPLRHFRSPDHRVLRDGRPGARCVPRRRIHERRGFRGPHARGITLAFVTDPRFSSHQARRSSLLAVAAVLLASGAVGFLSYRILVRPETAPLRKAAPPVAPPAAGSTDAGGSEAAAPSPPKVPERLPGLELPAADGKVHRLAEWGGRPLVINFWATWCDPCRREIPLLKALRRALAADGLEIVGIAIDYPDSVRKYA